MQTFDRWVAVGGTENRPSGRWRRANDEFQLTGDLRVLQKAIVEEPGPGQEWRDLARFQAAMQERDYSAAARSLAAVPDATYRKLSPMLTSSSRAFDEALIAVATNAPAKQEALLKARNLSDPQADLDLALLDAFLGQKEKAIEEAGRRALEQRPGPAGSIERNQVSSALAMIYAQTGEPEKAITLIEHLLTVPCELQGGAIYDITLTNLKWRWQWDPLRRDPRFQKILAAPESATVF